MPAESVRERFCQWLHTLGVQEQTFQVEPDLAVMARLKDEMTFSFRKELLDLLVHLPAV